MQHPTDMPQARPLQTKNLISPFELRRAFLQKRLRPFVLVFRRADDTEQASASRIQAFRQRQIKAVVHRLHGILNRQRGVGNDLRRNRLRARNQLGGGNNFS